MQQVNGGGVGKRRAEGGKKARNSLPDNTMFKHKLEFVSK